MAHRLQYCIDNHGEDPLRDASGHCSGCRRERKARERAERRALIRALKLARGCMRCRYRDDPRRLHLHHRDPGRKTATVAYMVRWGKTRLLAEVAKCDVLCAGCHTAHHHPRSAAAERARAARAQAAPQPTPQPAPAPSKPNPRTDRSLTGALPDFNPSRSSHLWTTTTADGAAQRSGLGSRPG